MLKAYTGLLKSPQLQRALVHTVAADKFKLVPFNSTHYDDVRAIAMKNISALVQHGWRDPERCFLGHVDPLLNPKDCLVSEVGGKVVGFITAEEQPVDWRSAGERHLNIEHLAVDEDAQGLGVGSALLGEVLKESEEDGVDYVKVGVTDFDLIEFYAKHKFTESFRSPLKHNRYASLLKEFDQPGKDRSSLKYRVKKHWASQADVYLILSTKFAICSALSFLSGS